MANTCWRENLVSRCMRLSNMCCIYEPYLYTLEVPRSVVDTYYTLCHTICNMKNASLSWIAHTILLLKSRHIGARMGPLSHGINCNACQVLTFLPRDVAWCHYSAYEMRRKCEKKMTMTWQRYWVFTEMIRWAALIPEGNSRDDGEFPAGFLMYIEGCDINTVRP